MTIRQVKAEIADHLYEIARLFRPGAKLTILIRHPHIPNGDADVLMTDDDLGEAMAAMRKLDADQREV